MYAFKLFKGLGPIDAKNVGRDPMLRAMIGLPIVIALAMRLVLPAVLTQLGALLRLDLLPLYPLIAGYTLLVIGPMMCGLIVGFLLLDQRDDGTLAALRVTPLPLGQYLAYRLAAPMLLSLPMTLLAFPVAGLHTPELAPLFAATLAAAPLAPVFALALATLASNKVQGFALAKVANLLLFIPLLANAVPAGWRLAFGVVPTYWPAQLIWTLQAGAPFPWGALLAGLLCDAVVIVVLLRRFQKLG
ncbi:MAG TPA: hypothetical protein VFX76_13805 [Roseiflexaceae bacterium]|nr:hypothetical protein [Roseiflexaceae bacterium]